MKVRHVRVGSALTLARRHVDVEPAAKYYEIGLRSFGKGIFHKPPVTGADLGTKRVFAIADGDLVVSNVFAWEGAVAVAGSNETGRIGSHRFMTWVADPDQADVNYLYYYLTSNPGLQQLRHASPGSAGRNKTLSIKAFGDLMIPLPNLDEQHAIAGRLDHVAEGSRSLRDAASSRPDLLRTLPILLDQCFLQANLPRIRADGLFSVVSDTVHPADDPAPATKFVGLEHIERDSGRRVGAGPVTERTGRKFRYLGGDVLYGYLRPYLNKAWAADGPGLCSVEQYVLRPNTGVSPTLLSYALRTGSTLNAVKHATHRLQLPRIRTGLLGAINIPDVRRADTSLSDRLAAVERHTVNLHTLYSRHAELTASLITAARNEVFSELM